MSPNFLRSSRLYVMAAACLIFLGLSQAHAQTTWNLVWSDEFNGPANSAPNPNTWAYDTGGGGWGNGELETYCAPFSGAAPCNSGNSNIYEDGNGNLVIKAINNNGTWTSGRMNTIGKETFQYGRIEARMKLPVGAGFWPAFWMLGNDLNSGTSWPTCGEQDIMEWVQSYTPTTTSSTVHGPGYSGGNGIGARYTFPNGGRIDDGAYHTYGVIWAANSMQFYRDDYTKPFLTVTPATIPAGDQWVYNQPFFILLNFAIGSGGFPGATNSSTPTTGTVLVDYVRVYQAGTSNTGGGGTSGAVAIDAGGGASGSYIADADFSGGSTASTGAAINTSGVTNPAPQAVYQTERYGNSTYTIPGLTAGSQYSVTLHFAEIYWNAAGKREFNASINGTQVLNNFDIFAAAGGENIAIAKTFNATANSSGQVVVNFANGAVDQAKISGIQVAAAAASGGGGGATGITGNHIIEASYNNGFVVDDWAASTASGNKVDLYSANGTAAQSWSFSTSGVNPAGDYNIAVLGANCMQAAGTANGSAITIAPCNGASNQAWNVVGLGTGYTLHPASAPGMCLDSPSSTTAAGTALQIWACSGAPNQTWDLK